MDTFDNFERCLLLGTKINSDDGNISELSKCILEGNFEEVLQGGVSQCLLKGNNSNTDITPETLKDFIQKNIQCYVSCESEQVKSRCLEVLQVAVACLQLFVQCNWTGPKVETCSSKFLPDSLRNDEKKLAFNQYIMDALSCDGEPLYELVVSPEYLFIARVILLECREHLQVIKSADWWLMRCLQLHQEFLDDKSPTIKDIVMEIIDKAGDDEYFSSTKENNNTLAMIFHIEAGHMCHKFYEYKKAKVHFELAEKCAGLKVDFTSALGKRTRFQKENKPQLALVVKRLEGEDTLEDPKDIDKSLLPQNLALNDETVLEAIEFMNPEEVSTARISDEESVVLFGLLENFRRVSANHETKAEELEAFITAVLSQPRVWAIQISALFLRSKLQKNSSRRIDRSLRQMEDVINYSEKPDPPAQHRMQYFYAANVPSLTVMRAELAGILCSLGAYGSACEIYERLHKWEDVIICYQKIGKTEKAESIIRDQLAIKETPNLYCFLGDVTREMEYYDKAWELSNHRSARAQRCMGYLYMGKQKYEESMECFKKSLDINVLQIPVWFTYGCASMAARKFEVAVKAFHRCVSLDFDNYEAWGNLSTCYIKLNQREKAFAVLKDAIKCNYENWRLWENCLVIGTDCKRFGEVITAYHRLLDLREKWMDVEVLGILSSAIVEDIPDADGIPVSQLRQKTLELFGRIASKGISNGHVWEAYARVADGDNEQDKDKCLQYLKKAHQYTIQENNWEKDVKKVERVGNLSLKLAKAYSDCISAVPQAQALTLASSAKLMLRSCVTKIKQEQSPLPEELKEIYQSLEEQLEKFTQLQTDLKGP